MTSGALRRVSGCSVFIADEVRSYMVISAQRLPFSCSIRSSSTLNSALWPPVR